MSATREILCEKIGVLEEALALALESCIDKTDKNIEYLRDEIFSLRKQLNIVNRTLNEGSSILKG